MEFLPKRKSRSSLSEQGRHASRSSSMEAPCENSVGCSSADEAMIIDDDEENDLQDVQLVDDCVLKGVVAYVEVRTKMENRSSGVRKQLERLGAVVVKRFTNDEPVTHVIWKDGKQSTKEKAIKRGLHLVSVLWVDSCKQSKQRTPESLFPVKESNDRDTIVIPKIKRMKSMQPKPFEEDLESSTERMVRKRKKKEAMRPANLHISSPGTTGRPYTYVEETQDPRTPIGTPVPGTKGTPSLIPDTPASMRACLDALERVRTGNKTPRSGSDKPVIGESPTFGAKSDVLQKKLSFSPSVEANSSENSDQSNVKKTNEANSMNKKGRRSHESQKTAKKESTKIRRLSLRIEKSLSERESDDNFTTNIHFDNDKHVENESAKQEENQKKKNKYSTQSPENVDTNVSENLTSCHVDLSRKGRRKRKLLSTSADVEPSQVLTEPFKSSKKDGLEKELKHLEKSSRFSSLNEDDLMTKNHGNHPENGVKRSKNMVSSEPVKNFEGQSSRKGTPSARKRKKQESSSESSEDEVQNPTKKSKGDRRTSLNSTVTAQQCDDKVTSRKSLDDFVQNTHFNRLKSKHKKGRAASLSSASPESSAKIKNKSASNSFHGNKKNGPSLSLTVASTKHELSPENRAKAKTATKSRTNSEMSKLGKKSKHNRLSLVMTSVHGRDQDLITSVVKNLGGFAVEENVTKQTTHVVCGETRRTLNVLRCIARGCWLLSLEWVLKSLEAEHWLTEEPFEVNEAFPAARRTRLERCVTGESYQNDLLASTGPIYIDGHTTPPKTSMVELVSLCGGQLCSSIKQADLCIGGGGNQTEKPAVSEKWLLDCISQHKLLPFTSYSL